MTPEPLTADERPRVSDDRLADVIANFDGSFAVALGESLALDLRDARRELAGAKKMVAAQSIVIAGFIGFIDEKGEL